MSRWIIIGFAVSLAGASTAEAQWLYWLEVARTDPVKVGMYRKPLDGGAKETVLASSELINNIAPAGSQGQIATDLVAGRIYWQQRSAPGSGNTTIWRADLDGTNQEAFATSEGGADQPFINPPLWIVRPSSGTIPAVSTWGLGVMLLALLVAATLVMGRRQPPAIAQE